MQIPACGLSVRKLTSVKLQNTTRFHSRLYYVHPARGKAKSGITGAAAMIMMGCGTERPENGTSRQKWDGGNPVFVVACFVLLACFSYHASFSFRRHG